MKRNCTKTQNEVGRLDLTHLEDLAGLPAELKVDETLDLSGVDPTKLKAISENINQFLNFTKKREGLNMKKEFTETQNEVARLDLTDLENLFDLPDEIKVGETLDLSGVDPTKLKAISEDIKQFLSNLEERS